MKNKRGITLIALIITIVVLLILAGVSINAVIGDNGIITQVQMSTIATKVANYKEEFEMNLLKDIDVKNPISSKENITVLNENMKEYIPSLEESDYSEFGILAGELYYLGDNDMFKKACKTQGIKMREEEQTVEEFIGYVEGKALESIMKNMNGTAFTQTDENGNTKEAGIPLKDKGVGVANWKIIVANDKSATFGTGYYYVESGSTIDKIGKLKNSYIINYESKKAVLFDANKYAMLSDKEGIAAGRDYLICNIDPASIEKNSTNFGKDVEFVNFTKDEDGKLVNAFTNTEFLFDGVDDYIKIKYESQEDKEKMAENGFTFEFYGIFDGGTSYDNLGKILTLENAERVDHCEYKGLFCYWNGKEDNQARLRFGLHDNGKTIFWNSGLGTFTSTFSSKSSSWNQRYPKSELVDNGKEVYIQISLDCKNKTKVDGVEYYHQACYVNGELLCKGDYSKDSWDYFITENNELKDLKYFCVGRSSMHNDGWWNYSKMNAYALRLYSKGLSEQDLKANYNATVAYHNILVNGGEAGTSGTPKDEIDLGNIN